MIEKTLESIINYLTTTKDITEKNNEVIREGLKNYNNDVAVLVYNRSDFSKIEKGLRDNVFDIPVDNSNATWSFLGLNKPVVFTTNLLVYLFTTSVNKINMLKKENQELKQIINNLKD